MSNASSNTSLHTVIIESNYHTKLLVNPFWCNPLMTEVIRDQHFTNIYFRYQSNNGNAAKYVSNSTTATATSKLGSNASSAPVYSTGQ